MMKVLIVLALLSSIVYAQYTPTKYDISAKEFCMYTTNESKSKSKATEVDFIMITNIVSTTDTVYLLTTMYSDKFMVPYKYTNKDDLMSEMCRKSLDDFAKSSNKVDFITIYKINILNEIEK